MPNWLPYAFIGCLVIAALLPAYLLGRPLRMGRRVVVHDGDNAYEGTVMDNKKLVNGRKAYAVRVPAMGGWSDFARRRVHGQYQCVEEGWEYMYMTLR